MKSKEIPIKDKTFGVPQRVSGVFNFNRTVSGSNPAFSNRLNVKSSAKRSTNQTVLTSFFNSTIRPGDQLNSAFESLLEVDESGGDQSGQNQQEGTSNLTAEKQAQQVQEQIEMPEGEEQRNASPKKPTITASSLQQADIQAIAESVCKMMSNQANAGTSASASNQSSGPHFTMQSNPYVSNMTKSHSNPNFGGYSQGNNSTLFDIELEQFKLNRASEKSCLLQHPWLKYSFYFGFTKVVKDLRSITCDWLVIRSVLRWCSEEDDTIQNSLLASANFQDNEQFNTAFQNTLTHRRRLLFAISKIISVYIIFDEKPANTNQKNASGNNPASLLLRMVNVIDTNFSAGNVMTENSIKETLSDFTSELDIPKRSFQSKNTPNSLRSSSGKSVRTLLCNDFNSSKGCSYGDNCKFTHGCKKHYAKDGSIQQHSATTCSLP